MIFIVHSSDPTPPLSFLKAENVNIDYLPRTGGSEKLEKEDGSIVQGQVFLKGEADTFSI